MYRADRQLICNTCAIIKTGEISYNFENEDMDFSERKMS